MKFSRQDPRFFQNKKADKSSLDSELNYIISAENDLLEHTDSVVSHGIPGLDRAENVHKIPSTDGIDLYWSYVGNNHIKARGLMGNEIKDSSISLKHLSYNSIGTNQIADKACSVIKFEEGLIDSKSIQDNSLKLDSFVSESKPSAICGNGNDQKFEELNINDNMLFTRKYNDINISTMTFEDLFNIYAPASDYLSLDKITLGTLSCNVVGEKSVNEYYMGNDSVNTQHFSYGSVTGDKFANNSITNEKIATGTITGNKILNNTLTADKFVEGALKNFEIDGSIFVDNTIYGTKIIAPLQINSFIDYSISGRSLEYLSLTTDKIGLLHGRKIKYMHGDSIISMSGAKFRFSDVGITANTPIKIENQGLWGEYFKNNVTYEGKINLSEFKLGFESGFSNPVFFSPSFVVVYSNLIQQSISKFIAHIGSEEYPDSEGDSLIFVDVNFPEKIEQTEIPNTLTGTFYQIEFNYNEAPGTAPLQYGAYRAVPIVQAYKTSNGDGVPVTWYWGDNGYMLSFKVFSKTSFEDLTVNIMIVNSASGFGY